MVSGIKRLPRKIEIEPAHKIDMPDHGRQNSIEIDTGDIVSFVKNFLQGQGVP